MIVLHEPKIIVLKARKVGGTSLEIALSKYATETSIITPIAPADELIREKLGFRGPQNYEYSEQEKARFFSSGEFKKFNDERDQLKFYNHISAEEAKKRLGADVWNNYTKVSIIRNPFEYLVSVYFFLLNMQGKSMQDISFEQWFSYNKDKVTLNDEIYKINNELVVDVLVNYSALNIDMMRFESQFIQLNGLTKVFQNIKAKGQIRPKYASIDYMYKNAPSALEAIYAAHSDIINKYNFATPNV